MKLTKKVLLACCCICLALPLCAQEDSTDPESDQELPGDNGQPEKAPDPALQHNLTILDAAHEYDLNPHTASYSSEAQILTSVYEGLYSYNPVTLDPVPALAVSYKLSRNKLRWTFTLRENAQFSDGSPITAQTIKDSWMALLQTPDAPYASLLDCIKGVPAYRSGSGSADTIGITARDALTLIIDLSAPAAHLPRILCHHAFAAVSPTQNVYSGPFMVQEYKAGKLILARNTRYWDAAHVAIPQITVIQSDDIAENAWQYNSGSADWVSGVVDTNKLLSRNSIRIAAEFGTEYLFFSCKNAPWNTAAFRNALISAVPWKELRTNSLVPSTTLVYPLNGYPSVEGLSDTDADEAKALMADARKAAGIPADQDIPLIFGISGSDRMKKEAELLKAAWAPLGVTLSVQVTPESRYLTSISGWNADLFSYSWIGDFADPLAFLELFRDGSTLKETSWHNDEFMKYLADAAATTDTDEHYKLLSQAEQLLLDDGVILPISHPVSLHAIDLDVVGGWATNALDIHPFKYLYFKEQIVDRPNVVLHTGSSKNNSYSQNSCFVL
jgi:oligopeptide transport system substrate-binding protein